MSVCRYVFMLVMFEHFLLVYCIYLIHVYKHALILHFGWSLAHQLTNFLLFSTIFSTSIQICASIQACGYIFSFDICVQSTKSVFSPVFLSFVLSLKFSPQPDAASRQCVCVCCQETRPPITPTSTSTDRNISVTSLTTSKGNTQISSYHSLSLSLSLPFCCIPPPPPPFRSSLPQ